MRNSLLTLSTICLLSSTVLAQGDDLCPNPADAKYEAINKEAAMQDPVNGRITVVINGAALNGQALVQEIEGGWDCIKAARDPKKKEDFYRRDRATIFCGVDTAVGLGMTVQEGVVKSVAQIPHIVGDIADIGDSATQDLMRRNAEFMAENSGNPLYYFGGILAGLGLVPVNGATKIAGGVTHHVGGTIDTLVNYNVKGVVTSVATMAQGAAFLLTPMTFSEGLDTFGDGFKEFLCRGGTILPNLFFGRKMEVRPTPDNYEYWSRKTGRQRSK